MISNAPLIDHYSKMLRLRAFEQACLVGFAAREIHGELHLGIGQEAVAAALIPYLRPRMALSVHIETICTRLPRAFRRGR